MLFNGKIRYFFFKYDKILFEKLNIIVILVIGIVLSVVNDNDENIWISSYLNFII